MIARGRIAVYEPKGEYQLVCEHLQPHGLGARQLAFEQLKKKLQAEGLFDAARKRPLPALPGKIGIVTSLDGAARARHRQRPRPASSERAPRDQAGAGAGDGAGADIAEALRSDRARAGRRRHHRRSRRRLGRRSDGRSTRNRWRARSRRAPVPVVTGRRPRGRLHDRRLRRRPARADALGGGGDRRRREGRVRARASTGRRDACGRRSARQIGRARARVHVLVSRRGLAALPARLALRGRHAAELTHQLRRARHRRAWRGASACSATCARVSKRARSAAVWPRIHGRLNAAGEPARRGDAPAPCAAPRAGSAPAPRGSSR